VNLGQFLLLVVILAAILAFVGAPWWAGRRREPAAQDSSGSYLGAIDALIRGDRPAGLAHLRDLARSDPGNLRAYIRLGDLLRRMGYPERAYRIHADLLARSIPEEADRRRLYESALEDLRALDRPDEEMGIAEKLLAIDPRSAAALRSLVRQHERRGDWDRALAYLDDWDRLEPQETRPSPAQMRIEMARGHMEAGRLKEARKLLDEAAGMPRDGAIARILMGDLLAQEGDLERACEEWIAYLGDHGHQADQVLVRLERAYFELGRFGDLAHVYETLAAGRQGNPHAAIALAEMHRRRGRLEEAARQLEALLEQRPGERRARRRLVGALLALGRTEQAMRELDGLLAEIDPPSAGSACAACGAPIEDVSVRCRRCASWLEPARGERLPETRPRIGPHAD